MPVRIYKPTSRGPPQDERVGLRRDHAQHAGAVARSRASTRAAGATRYGRVTSWHRGGGHKRLYRRIDFRRDKVGIPAKVASVEYDPNRSANIALLHYKDGEKRYILAPHRPARWAT